MLIARRSAGVLLAVGLASCGGSSPSRTDATVPDAPASDSRSDAPPADAPPADAPPADAPPADAPPADAPPADAAPVDAPPADAAPADAPPADGASRDAPVVDANSSDAGPQDAIVEARTTDAGPLGITPAHVAAGGTFTCRIRSGELWCWGFNAHGEVGNGTTAPAPLPVRIGLDADWAFVTAGSSTACGIRGGGQLWCWGDWSVFLDGGGSSGASSPTRVGSAADWITASIGSGHGCGVRADHTLYCWGDSSSGQTGGAPASTSAGPGRVGADADWVAVSAGIAHTCGIRADSSLWCWGSNFFGQLADGSTVTRAVPVRAGGPGFETGWTEVVAADDFTCGINGGELYCWGFIGNGSPSPVGAAAAWTSVSGREWHVCGIEGGRAHCLGKDGYGELGDGMLSSQSLVSSTLRDVGADTDWVELSAGYDHTCGVHADGRFACWGSRAWFQFGDGLGPSFAPKAIDAASAYGAVDAGNSHACGRKTDGSLWCWGANQYGSAGAVNPPMLAAPVRVGTETSWASVSAGGSTSCATKTDGTLWCWGSNSTAQLGDGTTTNRGLPTQVLTSAGVTTSDWLDVSVGAAHTCGRRAPAGIATLFCWGSNQYNEIGDGAGTGSRIYPVPINTGAAAIANESAGSASACARLADGTLACWGDNSYGEVGTGSTATSVATPTPVNTATNWSSISVGGTYACAVKGDGTLWCWGANNVGQLGLGALGLKRVPTQVGTDTDWQSVAAGLGASDRAHTCAIKKDGSLYCWGASTMGELGTGTTSASSSPLRVGTGTAWASVAAGLAFTCAITSAGEAYCWGANDSGQLGDGTGWSTTPVDVP
jgi:alpha-tubulin suppressor-like RCC1 family protein